MKGSSVDMKFVYAVRPSQLHRLTSSTLDDYNEVISMQPHFSSLPAITNHMADT